MPYRARLALLISLSVAGCADGNQPRDAGADGGRSDAALEDAPLDDAPSDGATADAPSAVTTVTVRQIQDEAAAGHVLVGARVRVEGAIVAAVDTYEENGAGMGNVGDVWIADAAGGPFSGVHVYMPAHTTCAGRPSLGIGDVVNVEGTIQEFAVPSDASGRTVTQLTSGTVSCIASGTAPSPAVIADPASLTTDASAEAYEGVLVQLAALEASTEPDRFGTQSLRVGPPIDDDLYAHAGTARDRFVTVVGIFHYMFGRWELLPRAMSDVTLDAPRDIEDASGAWGCADEIDSDGDGAIDCTDADCAGSLFCVGARVTVQDLQDPTHAGPAPGVAVSLRGPLVITSIDGFAEMTGAGYTGTVVVQDPAATDARYAGIHVYVPDLEPCGGALALGDRVYVAGMYAEYAEAGDTGALTEIRTGLLSCQSPGTPLTATSIPTGDLATATTAEPWEGVLVEIADIDVISAPGAFGRFAVTGDVFIDDDVYRPSVSLGDHLARVTGVVSYQFEHQLEPRMASDVVIGPSERDDVRCGNDLDDDGDGAIDCSDLDCCGTAPCMGAVAARRLILSEVVYDATGADDGREWVELRNAGSGSVPLACYTLGNGSTSYRYSMAQLPAIEIPAGGCVVIGGPDCGGPGCTATIDFTPDFHNGTAGSASGVALLYGTPASITSATVPVDAVLYGTANTAMLLGASGTAPASAQVIDVAAGHSIARATDGSWGDLATPTPGSCALYTP
jgi:hypothetical protein